MGCRNTARLSLIFALLLSTLHAVSQNQPIDSPVGHWVAEHPSKGGIGSWWDFRSDNTLTMHIGAIVTSPITRSGDTFTSPPATANGAPITVSFRVDGDTLHIKSPNTAEQIFARIGPVPSTTDPLLGKWRPLLPATLSTDPDTAAQQKLMATATLAFLPDNTESVRIPFSTYEGAWDANTHTFHIKNQIETYTFQLIGSKLTLGQSPGTHKTDTYLPDPIL